MDPALIAPITEVLEGASITLPVKQTQDCLQHAVTGQVCVAKSLGMQYGEMATLHCWKVVSVYNNVVFLEQMEDSLVVTIPQFDIKQMFQCFEVCSGIAGTSMGARAIGVRPILACDQSQLSCDFLRLNDFPKVVLGDVTNKQIWKEIHVGLFLTSEMQSAVYAIGLHVSSVRVKTILFPWKNYLIPIDTIFCYRLESAVYSSGIIPI